MNPCRVAVYGGAFDPPNMAHVYAVTALLARTDVDEVWVMPAAHHAFGKQMAPFELRMEMLRLALQDFNPKRVKISPFEQTYGGSGRTYDTLDALSERYPQHQFLFVMGADNLTEAYRWYRFDELVKRWPVIVLGRPGHEASMQAVEHLPWFKQGPCLPAISSTEIRAAFLRGAAEIPELPAACMPIAKTLYTKPKGGTFGPVWVLGAGKAGQTLYGALKGAGVETHLWNRTAPGPEHRALYQIDAFGALPEALNEAPVWILAVDDRALPEMAMRLIQERPEAIQNRVVFHCAGRLSSQVLQPLALKGAATGSFHPLQSLGHLQSLYGVYCALEGSEKAVETGHAMAALLGCKLAEITAEQKTLYHAAAVFAGNFPSVSAECAAKLMHALGLSEPTVRQMLSPLLQSVVSRFALSDVHRSLTGPAVRGDEEAMAQHRSALRALSNGETLEAFYAAASTLTRDLLKDA